MNAPQGPAAPVSGTDATPIPTFAELAADPEIAPLLDFTPVPRSHAKANGWSAEMQRLFIGWLAYYGSATKAADELGKARSGIDKVYKSPDAAEFRASWDAAVALAEKRRIEAVTSRPAGAGAIRAPTLSRRTQAPAAGPVDINGNPPLPGQVINEQGEWEDEESYHRRGEEARDSISEKLKRARRLFLHDISGCPAKRAAFEILTELPVDWEVAALCRPQADEPWKKPNMRTPDMLLTAEAGWIGGDLVHGPDKKAELLAEINQWRAEQGLHLVCWKDQGPEEGEEPA